MFSCATSRVGPSSTAGELPAPPCAADPPPTDCHDRHSTADILQKPTEANGRVLVQLADGELISIKSCNLKPLSRPSVPTSPASTFTSRPSVPTSPASTFTYTGINWAEYSQLEARVRSLEGADGTHTAAATFLADAKKEHRGACSKLTACTRASEEAKENIEACETSWCAARAVLLTPRAALAHA